METVYAFPGMGKTYAFEQAADPSTLLDISSLHDGELNSLHGKEKGDELWRRFLEGNYTPETLLVNLYDHTVKGSELRIDRAVLPDASKFAEILEARPDADPTKYKKWLKDVTTYMTKQGIPVEYATKGQFLTDFLR